MLLNTPPLLSIAYAPPISYFKLLSQGTCLVEACETFQKQTYRNRCRILTPNGIEDLVIPVEQGASSGCPIQEVKISQHDHWWTRHLQALQSAYGKTPFYEFYIDDIAPFYEEQCYHSLFDFNLALTKLLARLMHLPIEVILTSDYQHSYPQTRDYRESIHPKRDDARFFTSAPYYHRFPHVDTTSSGVSIYDLLFNMGPESVLVLTNCQIRPMTASSI